MLERYEKDQTVIGIKRKVDDKTYQELRRSM
jgi:hypothetical protein